MNSAKSCVGDFQKNLKIIYQKSKDVLKQHDTKIRSMEETLGTLTQLSDDTAQLEYQANQDKLRELLLQKNEFKKFLKNVLDKIVQIRDNNTYSENITPMLKNFGVECCRLQTALPLYARRHDIVQAVNKNQVCVILGETGSGKSTQMTQYLHQVGYGTGGLIICTQPRKIAAISLATRVASEMASALGNLVGYKVGMKSKMSASTRILYATDHVLLNECLQDKLLSKYKCVIIDEAHERSIYTDLLLGMIKRCLKERPDLKLIVTSATIDPQVFVRYFEGCPVLEVSGRMFPVDVIYKDNPDIFNNYEQLAVQKAIEIHKSQPKGDILVFLTSPIETERSCDAFKLAMTQFNNFQCHALHGQVQPAEQQLVFEPATDNQRKIVFATNSAETSITIPGVRYVIDTGLAKEMVYDPKKNMNSLNVVLVSKSSANQRKGRAGRTASGTCFRLYSEPTYEDMTPSSVPEILKVHLGQALLKLSEMQINPLEYDFVQSPDRSAIVDTMKVLESIGALKDQHITERGRWLAKLPLDPIRGTIIAHGKEKNVTYESIIIAAATTTGSAIFFRGGSDVDKNRSDLVKIKFCHNGGDTLTSLNVYREWFNQPDKSKNAWCLKNFINSKRIRGLSDMVNDILMVLNKDPNENVESIFGEPSNVDPILQQILSQCFSTNVCHFLGREKAGYYAIGLDQRIQLHPSSALNSLGLTPEWITFEQCLKTSRDYITGITPVDEELVKRLMIKNNEMNFEQAKNKCLKLVHSEQVGSKMFWDIVGKKFSNMNTIEKDISLKADPTIVVVDADRERGEVNVFATDDILAITEFEIKRSHNTTLLRTESREIQPFEKNKNLKVVLGQGGQVHQLLLSDEYRKVFVENAIGTTSMATIKSKFSRFGPVEKCKEYENKTKRWGFVIFSKSSDAVRAVEQTENDEVERGIASKRADSGKYTAKLEWCRRKSMNFAFVEIRPEEVSTLLMNGCIMIKDRRVSVQAARQKDCSLCIKQLSDETTGDDIRSSLCQYVDKDAILSVKMIFEKVEKTSGEDLQIMKDEISTTINQYVKYNSFTVKMMEPTETAATFRAFVEFTDLNDCYLACERLNGTPLFRKGPLRVTPELSSTLFVSKDIYVVIREFLEDTMNSLKQHMEGVIVKLQPMNEGNLNIYIKSSESKKLAMVFSIFQDVVQGQVIECGKNPDMKYLHLNPGKIFLRELQSKMKCIIKVDDRTRSVHLIGTEVNRNKAMLAMNKYLSDILQFDSHTVNLRGPGLPCGVMKLLLSRYGSELDDFKMQMDLLSVQLNHRQHTVVLRGKQENVEASKQAISRISEELAALQSVHQDESVERPDCVVCFMPIEKDQLYRLEICGHSYCKDCIQLQLTVSVRDRQFPIVCSREHCSESLAWRDFFYFARNDTLSDTVLANSSVSEYVTKNQRMYRYCSTADCPSIYKVTAEGCRFSCDVCHIRLCTSCHVQYHEGLTCAMYKSESSDPGGAALLRLIEEDKNMKRCPKCQIPIEKDHGCNHMQCTVCKIHFCWICSADFPDSHACYEHLRREHGGLFDVPGGV